MFLACKRPWLPSLTETLKTETFFTVQTHKPGGRTKDVPKAKIRFLLLMKLLFLTDHNSVLFSTNYQIKNCLKPSIPIYLITVKYAGIILRAMKETEKRKHPPTYRTAHFLMAPLY